MMKHVYLTLAAIFLVGSASSQIIFNSTFETWSDMNTPDMWLGSKTNFQPDSVRQSTDGATFGPFLAELVNEEGSHRRLTSQPVALTEGTTYEVEVWVKGEGDLRVGVYDFDLDGFDFGYSYEPYVSISGSSVTSFVQNIVPDTTYSLCEIILSLNSGTVQVDRVEVRVGEAVEPVNKTIQEIQFTMDVDGASPEAGVLVTTQGVVTAAYEQGFWIQDGEGAWNGIFIRDTETAVSQGDQVAVTGVVEESFFNTRITDVSAVSVTGTSALPEPTVLGTNAVNDEAYEGVLVRTIGDCTVLPDNFGEWIINDDSGDIIVNDEMFAFTPVLSTTYQVTGPTWYAFGNYRIEPRNAADVTVFTSLNELSSSDISFFPNPSSDFLTVNTADKAVYDYFIFDSAGRMVDSGRLTNTTSQIDVRAFATGQYMIQLNSGTERGAFAFQIVR